MKDKILNVLMLLSVAAALIFTFIQEKKGVSAPVLSLLPSATFSPTPSPRPIDAYRLHRERTRQEESAALSVLSQNALADEEIRRMAQMQLTEIAERNEIELAAEAALIARGYPDALCIFQAGNMTVLLTKSLSEADAAWIFQLIREVTNLEMENIRVCTC